MRSAIYLSLLLAPLSALAGTKVASDMTANIARRELLPMKAMVARTSPARHLARSPRPDDDDVCSSDEIRCGDACVPSDYRCCPEDVNGGCPTDEECQEDDGRWGCCPDGRDCHWDNDNDDDDDDDNIFDNIGDTVDNIGDNIEDGFNDIFGDDDDAGASTRPGMITVGLLASVAIAIGVL